MSKGQSMNIDWTVGLALFLTAFISAIVIFVNTHAATSDISDLRNSALDIQDSLEEEVSIEVTELPILVTEGYEIEGVPLHQEYSFPDGERPGSVLMSSPVQLTDENEFVTVIDTQDTYSIFFFEEDSGTEHSLENDITTDETRYSNSYLDVEFGGNGLVSLESFEKEFLSDGADLGYEGYSVEENDVFAVEQNTDLRIYNSSQEMILNDAENVVFSLEEFGTLYWHEENEIDLREEPSETVIEGDTKGISLSENGLGITFVGRLEDASLVKNDDSTLELSFSSDKARIRTHQTEEKGIERIGLYESGDIGLGAGQRYTIPHRLGIEQLDQANETELESRLDINTNLGYNISFGEPLTGLSRGEEPLNVPDVVLSERSSLKLVENGTFQEVDSRVFVWQ